MVIIDRLSFFTSGYNRIKHNSAQIREFVLCDRIGILDHRRPFVSVIELHVFLKWFKDGYLLVLCPRKAICMCDGTGICLMNAHYLLT